MNGGAMKSFLQRLSIFGSDNLDTQSGYEIAKLKEIENYKDVINIHELPDIFHYWSRSYLRPILIDNDFSSIDDFFAKNL